MHRIYIIESIFNLQQDLMRALCREHQVMVCIEPEQALTQIREFDPDFIVMDMTMPGQDWLGLLRVLFTAGIRPKLVVSMNYAEDAVEKMLTDFHASFLLMRPVKTSVLLDRISDVLLELDGDDNLEKRKIANNLMLKLGLRLDLQGYRYTLEALVYIADHMNCLLSNELYPAIAKKLGGNEKQVEHVIRCCIQKAYQNRDERIWDLYFSRSRYGHLNKMSNGIFLKRIAFAVNDFYNYTKQDMRKAQNQ